MGVFEEVGQFLETRLEEFLKQNPQLELQVLLDQLQSQEQETRRLVLALEKQQAQEEAELLTLAQDIQLWHGRVEKARNAQRPDLAGAAQEREAQLLGQGNQLWSRRLQTLERLKQAQDLIPQIQRRRREVQQQIDSLKQAPPQPAQPKAKTPAPEPNYTRGADPLDAEFQRWELEDELNRLKRNL
ncbi:MAG: TIGR04376 family protein [Cyanobacteria bacterium RI_101]|nr:TIGR04376 family protein [Cyanobacteria bacterium RI_101]